MPDRTFENHLALCRVAYDAGRRGLSVNGRSDAISWTTRAVRVLALDHSSHWLRCANNLGLYHRQRATPPRSDPDNLTHEPR